MKDRKIWKLLTALKAREADAFCRWLEAEMGERQAYLRRLATVLCRDLKHAPQAANVWQALYPEKTYDDGRLRKLSGDLTSYLEAYLAILAFRKDRDTCDLYLIREINQRKQPDIFDQIYHKVYDRIIDATNKNADYYRMMLELEREKQRFDITHRIPYAQARPEVADTSPVDAMSRMQRINYAFDSWWLHEKMELAPHNVNTENLHKETIDSVLIEEVLDVIENHPLHRQQPGLAVNKNLYLFLRGQNTQGLSGLIRLLIEKREFLTKDELRNLFTFLINHFARQINQTGDIDATRDTLSLYEWAIEEKLILVNNYLPATHYKNIVATCLRVQDHGLALRYLDRFRPLLSPEVQQDTYLLNLSKCHYARGDYAAIIEILSRHKFRYVVDEIDARAFLLQAHYELRPDDADWLYAQAEKLIRFVRGRKDYPKALKQAYINQYRLFSRILNAQNPEEIHRLETAVQETRPISQPVWLARMIDRKKAQGG